MNRGYVFLAVMFLVLVTLMSVLTSCGGGSGSGQNTSAKINHVVIIFQENRTPDNLFHDQNLINEGADIASQGINSLGQVIPLGPVVLAGAYDLDHSHKAFVEMYDGGKMDGADKITVSACKPPSQGCPPPNPWFKYVQTSDVAPYFTLAETYTFADRMFQTNQGPSFPAHQFIISGTSAPATGSDLFAAENPLPYPEGDSNTGCTAPSNISVMLIDPSGNETPGYPCYDHATLTDELNAQSLSWKYYAAKAGSIWTGPNAIKHMCQPDSTGTVCTGSDWTNNVVLNSAQVLTDIANGQLANVTWIIPTGQESDHAGLNDGSGPSWVASIVNAIGNSQFWGDTAILIAWDDWGGWYDHVPPSSIYNSYEYGFRVPLIVVSPYAKPHYISHPNHDFGSILKFIETTFNLSVVDPTYADARADDLSDCFDFTQAPLPFQAVAQKVPAKFFIRDRRPPLPPDND